MVAPYEHTAGHDSDIRSQLKRDVLAIHCGQLREVLNDNIVYDQLRS